MRNKNWTKKQNSGSRNWRLRKIMQCLCSGEHLQGGNEMILSSESLATKDYSASAYSSRATAESDKKPDTGNIEEAELSLRESSSLNYEEARALLGRYEYQKGNLEAALHVFEGIDISSVIPKMKITLGWRPEPRKKRSNSYSAPPMSIHAVSLLMEAIYLKAKSLQSLGRYQEAAQSCTAILDVIESSLPEGLPANFGADGKLQETFSKAVELLPELWKFADSPREAILSFRRALLNHWNLDSESIARIQKEFAIYLLYSGGEASPPNLRFQMGTAFVPRNNIEEALLLLMILLRKVSLKRIEWDPSVLDHLTYALSISGGLRALANQMEEFLPGIIERKERYLTLALCYYGQGDCQSSLNLLRKIFKADDPNCGPALILASKICGETPKDVEEGVGIARRAIQTFQGKCDQMVGHANYLLGISLSEFSRLALTDSDRVERQSEALQSLETANTLTRSSDSKIVYCLSLENAEQRKLEAALYYAKRLIKLEGGSTIKGWLLLARVLSALGRFTDGETIIDAALDQTGKWDQGELLRTKAKIQIAQGQIKSAIKTYTELLAVLQVQNKSFGLGKKVLEDGGNYNRKLELDTWHDLAMVYIGLSQWRDAEICLSKSAAISYYSASRWHITGLLNESKGLLKEAMGAFQQALDIDPRHVPSLISMAMALKRGNGKSLVVIRSFLTEALRLDRMDSLAWYNLGLLCKDEGPKSAKEAADCFEAAASLRETEPIERFR